MLRRPPVPHKVSAVFTAIALGTSAQFATGDSVHSTASVHEVDCQDLSSDAEGLSVLTVAGPVRAGIFVDVFIAGKSLKFLVDSGSSVSILEESIFKQHFANESLLSAPRVKLLDYSKRCIPVRGCFFTEVTFKGRTVYLLFYVVAEGTSILGIDAIRILDLHIEGSSLHCFETSTMPATLDAAQLSGSCKVSPTNSLPKTLSSEFGSL
ncbi:hypothetical protein MTO96_021793 [Rhipicephalus appendiculatus]